MEVTRHRPPWIRDLFGIPLPNIHRRQKASSNLGYLAPSCTIGGVVTRKGTDQCIPDALQSISDYATLSHEVTDRTQTSYSRSTYPEEP
jgi:hypothetical protein